MVDNIDNALSRIQALQQDFAKKLSTRINELCLVTEELLADLPVTAGSNPKLIQKIHDLAHKLAGSAGTFQFTEVYNHAKNLENFCSRLLELNSPADKDWFSQLQQLSNTISSATEQQENNISLVEPDTATISNDVELKKTQGSVVLVDDDELLSSLIQEQARHFSYQIHCINNPEQLSDFLSHESPDIILMDIVFPQYALNGIELVKQLKTANKLHCPVIFLSSREDFNARLEAVRAGGSGYLVKPIDILALVEILDRYTKSELNESYRALIIDDDPIVASAYTETLKPFHFHCKSVTNPLSAIEELLNFRPDIILLDINMPDCSGLEVAEVIRQDNRFTHIPIIFLTADNSNTNEVSALQAGGDYFLNKNTPTKTFVTSVIRHSQRSKELHKVVDRLRKDEVRFQAVSHSISDAIVTLNKQGRIILWNRGAEEIFSYQAIEMIGQTIDIIIPKQYQENIFYFHQTLETPIQEHHSLESYALTKEKNLISIELSYTHWFSANEQFFTAIIRDISQRKKVETALKYQQENLNAIISSSAEGIISIDYKGVIEMLNPRALTMFLYTEEELIGQNISILMHHSMRKKHDEYLAQSKLYEAKVFNKSRELKGLRKDGSLFPLELSVSPMHINGEKKYVGMLHDVTEDQKILNTIISAKLEAEKANHEKSQFLSSMSHELRTPLNAILGFSQLLMEDNCAPLNADQSESMGHVNSAGHQLLKLIDEVLDLSAIENGRIGLHIEKVNLNKLILQCIRLHQIIAQKAQVSINTQLSTTKDVFLSSDTFRLSQVLSNLLSNAIKYNRILGEVTIWIEQGEHIRIFVKNTGIGIAEENIKSLFKPFNRLGAESLSIEGTGLGLTISKRLIEMMGGKIGIESDYGESCTFWVELAQDKAIKTSTKLLPLVPEPVFTIEQSKKINILYIEDTLVNCLLMKKIISKQENYHYTEATTGEEGIKMALKNRPDIILLDINLVDMHGFDVFKQLQAAHIGKTSEIIAVSANAMPADILQAKKLGFFGYITKPINPEKLFACISEALKRNKKM